MTAKFEMFPKKGNIVEVSQDWYGNHVKALAATQVANDLLIREAVAKDTMIEKLEERERALEGRIAEIEKSGFPAPRETEPVDVAQAREAANHLRNGTEYYSDMRRADAIHSALDALERLARENAYWREKTLNAENAVNECAEYVRGLETERDAAKAEVERLRAALKSVREKAGSHTVSNAAVERSTSDPGFAGIYAVADAALAMRSDKP